MTQLKKTAKTQRAIKRIEEIENISDEAKILGESPATVEKTIYDYENPDVKYKVTNLVANNNPIIVRGDVIETFIGSKNIEARERLKTGAKKVVTKDLNGEAVYKIEVL